MSDVITQKEIAELQLVKDELFSLSNRRFAIEADFLRRLRAGATFPTGGPYEVSEDKDGKLRIVIWSS